MSFNKQSWGGANKWGQPISSNPASNNTSSNNPSSANPTESSAPAAPEQPISPSNTSASVATQGGPSNPPSNAAKQGPVIQGGNPRKPQPTVEQNNETDLKSRIHTRLIDEIDLSRIAEGNNEQLRWQLKEAISQLLVEENMLFTTSERDRMIQEILNETMGLGPLEPLLNDPSISEIMILGPKLVYIERKGKLIESHVQFKDDGHLLQIIDRIVSAVGRRVDETMPLCDARLKDGSRFNCVIPPLALDGPLVTIRKFSKDPLKIDDLVRFGSLTPQAAELLKGFVQGRLNIVISGGTGSGKTTLLNVLSSFIPDDERIVTIEDTAELQLQQHHVARMETRPANIEGKGEINQRDLVKNALRMRPERIVLGECRGGEALDMLQAMNTGHDGSLTTLHANNPRDAIRRMETMVMMAGYDLPQKAIREQIASAVHVIVQASRLSDGSRKVMYISEVVGMEGDVILLQDVFKFHQYGVDDMRKIVGEFKYMGVRPKFMDHLIAEGVNLDMSLFEQPQSPI